MFVSRKDFARDLARSVCCLTVGLVAGCPASSLQSGQPLDAGGDAEAGQRPDAGLDADSVADAALEVSVTSATAACRASCAAQIEDCSSIDRSDCHGLCDFVVALAEERPGCLARSMVSWRCDLTQEWLCDPQQSVTGMAADSSVCASEVAALTAADCTGDAP